MQCIQVLKHVIPVYPKAPLDDLEGTKDDPCLVVRLSHTEPQLSVDVFKTNRGAFTIAIFPSLIEQGIDKTTVRSLHETWAYMILYQKYQEAMCSVYSI